MAILLEKKRVLQTPMLTWISELMVVLVMAIESAISMEKRAIWPQLLEISMEKKVKITPTYESDGDGDGDGDGSRRSRRQRKNPDRLS